MKMPVAPRFEVKDLRFGAWGSGFSVQGVGVILRNLRYQGFRVQG